MSEYRDQRAFEAYLETLRKYGTPGDVGRLLKALGQPDEVEDRIKAIDRLNERQERIEWLIAGAKTAAGWFVGIGAAVVMAQPILRWALTALTGAP